MTRVTLENCLTGGVHLNPGVSPGLNPLSPYFSGVDPGERVARR